MTSRYGKTYSKKGSAGNSKFDEVFSGKRAKISTKWGESTFKAQLTQKRPNVKAEAVEQPKRQKVEDQLPEDPFGFDSDDDSLPVSSRNPAPAKAPQSTESLKPADGDGVTPLDVNSRMSRPIGGEAVVCNRFASLADTVQENSSGRGVALCPETKEDQVSGNKLNSLGGKHQDPLREGIEKNSFPKNKNATENEKKAEVTSTRQAGFKADESPLDSWDEIMKSSGSPSEMHQRTEFQPWVGGLGRMPCVKNEASDGRQGRHGDALLNPDKPLELKGNQGIFERAEYSSFKDEEIENDSQPLRSNCRTYCRSNKGKSGSAGTTNFDKIIDGTGRSAQADLMAKDSLKLDTKTSGTTGKPSTARTARDTITLPSSYLSPCNVTLQDTTDRSMDEFTTSPADLGEAGRLRKKTEAAAGKTAVRFRPTQSKSKKDAKLEFFGFDEQEGEEGAFQSTGGAANYKIKYFGFDDLSESSDEDEDSESEGRHRKKSSVRMGDIGDLLSNSESTDSQGSQSQSQHSTNTDPLEFSDESNPNFPDVGRKQMNRQEKAKENTRKIFHGPKRSPTKAVYNARHWNQPEAEELPSTLSQSHNVAGSAASKQPLAQSQTTPVIATTKETAQKDEGVFKAPPPPPRVIKTVTIPTQPYQDIVTALKCRKEDKELYTVVQHVKHFNDVVEFGENQEFTDDIEYLLSGLKCSQPLNTRCLSIISLATKCAMPSFRMHLRAHGMVAMVFKTLDDAQKNQNLALCTAALMYILSRDRLNMDLDRASLDLMIRLLELDQDPCSRQLNEKEMKKIKEKIRKLCETVHNRHLDLENITTGHLAMETLLSLTSKRAGDWFKEELRLLGGLDHIVDKVKECVDQLSENEEQDKLVASLWGAERCLRVLESVTVHNPENQGYLIAYKDSQLIISSARALRHCEQLITRYNREDSKICLANSNSLPEYSASSHIGKAVEDCMRAIFGVLLNLTNDNEWGSTKTGEQDNLISTTMNCVLQVPQYIPQEQRFDIRVLGLGLLINLVEHSARNRHCLVDMETPCSFDSFCAVDGNDSLRMEGQVGAIEALVQLFLQRERAARLAETETDDFIKDTPAPPQDQSGQWQETAGSLEWVQSENCTKNDSEKKEEEDEEIDLNKALQHAGKHMEDCIVASYTALLLGCLCQESPVNVTTVRELLPEGDFSIMTEMLQKFLNFMNLTCAVGTTGQKSISRVIEYLDHC
ncbi:wings apart-like protein homolog [Pristis pectinata]|uniref:wings apart-like protein homolog n=1 Tax=Pristis pectinata TaxID=685728 RepID=UPI00223DA704|nr:wings apart-like protein homolog [Pristis pectinata]XP_051897362.1 wings apart-like protein homolog [Pristis pectinata]XP_051897363.1 wings apart-like protein homolog [Pristis pectinata]